MVPNGQTPPMGGAQSANPSLLRSNSGIFGSQGGPLPSQTVIPPHLSPRNQLSNMNMIGNASNVPSVLNQSFRNGVSNSGISGPIASRQGGIDAGAESDSLSAVGSGIGFNTPSSFVPSNLANPGSAGQLHAQQFSNPSGNRMFSDQQQTQQINPQNFQHGQQQFTASQSNQQPLSQQQLQSIRGGLSAVGQVKLEPQMNDHQGQQQLQSLRNPAPVKLEPQKIQSVRSLVPVKLEPQHSDQSWFLQQQQQQYLLSRQSPQASAAAQLNIFQQQRLLHLQQQHHHQQQQLLKALPQQRPPLQQQNLQMRSPLKPMYEPGTCARRLTHYMYQQQHRPEDNNIEFWRKFVAEHFAPTAKKKWCVSMYGSSRQTTGVFPQDAWHCEICNRKPGRGFEATVEVLPRLFKIKYESGTLEELLYVDMPREYQNSSGQIVLDYAKAIQESVFEQLRVVRDGQLRIVFTPDLKIYSWEFCARHHEELIPRRLLIPQVAQLGAAAQKYQAASQNASSDVSVSELQSNCNMFVASARQLAKTLEVPLVNDLGYTKRYVRCLQISEVVNCMKDLIDFSSGTGMGPIESLAKIPRSNGVSSRFHYAQAPQSEEQQQRQQSEQQQQVVQNSIDDQNSAMELASSNDITGGNNPLRTAATSTTGSSVVGILHQNSMNLGQRTSMNTASSSFGGSAQNPSPASSGNIPRTQPNPSFQSPTLSSSNNAPQQSHSGITAGNHMGTSNSPANMSLQRPALSGEADPSETQTSVQKIIHDMMMCGQLNGAGGMAAAGSIGNDVKSDNGTLSTSNNVNVNRGNCQVGNGIMNGNPSIGASGFNGGLGQSAMVDGIRAAMGNNAVMSGRIGMATLARDQSMNQQDLANQLLSGFGAVDGYNNLQFDWKTTR